MTVRPSYEDFGIGVYVKDRLVQAGTDGLVPADLWHDLKTNWKELNFFKFKGDGTYASFIKYWHVLELLHYVTKTGKTEPSHQRGGTLVLEAPRTYFRITTKGKVAGDKTRWSNPLVVLYPQADSKERLDYFREYLKGWRRRHREELIAMGVPVRRRGRPRVAVAPPPPKPPVKPPKIAKPPPPVAPLVVEQFEQELKALTPLFDKLVAEPGRVSEIEARLTDIQSRVMPQLKKVRGKQLEELTVLNSRIATTLEHLPAITAALVRPPGPARKATLTATVRALKEDLGI